MTPEKHSVERGCEYDDGDEADDDPGGSLVHFRPSRGSHISATERKRGGRSQDRRPHAPGMEGFEGVLAYELVAGGNGVSG
jgi:hypothetical protein